MAQVTTGTVHTYGNDIGILGSIEPIHSLVSLH